MSVQRYSARWIATTWQGTDLWGEGVEYVLAADHVAALAEAHAASLRSARYAVAVRLTQMGYDTEDTNPYLAAIDDLIYDGGQA